MPLDHTEGAPKSVQVDHQEVTGIVRNLRWHHPVLILAEKWPSMSFAVQALGCLDITTWCKFSSAKSKVEFTSTRLGSTLSSDRLDRLSKRFACLQGVTLIIQGSASFTNFHRKWAEDNLKHAKTLEVIPRSDITNWDNTFLWKGEVRHQDVGGVTTGVWSYRCSEPLPDSDISIKRNLGLVMKPTHGGKALSLVPKEILASRVLLSGDNLVDPEVTSPWIKSPSVYSKEGELVMRRLQIDELLDVYDTEVITQRELGVCWRSSQCTPSYAFAKAAPLKVLMEIGRLFYQKLRDDRWPPTLPLVNESTSTRKRRCEENITPEGTRGIEVVRQTLSSERSKRPRGNPSCVPTIMPVNAPSSDKVMMSNDVERDAKDPSVKAVKHDDAKVDARQWDEWSVNNYKSMSAAIVCIPNSYCVQNHSRLFDALRGLAVRWYRKKVLRSFLAYLRLQHGNGKTTPASVTVAGKSRAFEVSSWVKARYHHLKSLTKLKGGRTRDKSVDEFRKDLIVGSEAVWRASHSSWWSWEAGSTLMFWRWPTCHRVAIRDGTKAFIHRNRLPAYSMPQHMSKDPDTREKVKKKVNSVRARGYIREGGVKSITGFFDVPKGDSDIRMVYDATKCGLNHALWTPNFFLPTIDSILRNADADTWFGDIDLGEMFLNYWLDEELRPYAGVDVSSLGKRVVLKDGSIDFDNEVSKQRLWERWERTLMGFQSSPYLCTQAFGWSEGFILGDPEDHANNPLAWKEVKLNLPGSSGYQPTKPWVYRTKLDGSLAAFFGTYIDDIRTGDSSEGGCRKATRRVASRINYLGQQDAPRKRRPPRKKPGAWAGAMCEAVEEQGLFVTCSQEKWCKAKEIVSRRFQEVVVKQTPTLSYKTLEKDVGFLVHLSRTFPAIFPYLRGIYNTLNGWRRGRDHDGWKLTRREWDLFLAMEEEMVEDEEGVDSRPGDVPNSSPSANPRSKGLPDEVKPVPRLSRDLSALQRLFSEDLPPQRLVRGQLIHAVRYAFGDASKAGFGSSWMSSGGVKYRFGTWGRSMANGSSNLRELKNLVDTLKLMAQAGELEGSEVFIFTDNSTAEAAFFKGSSKSRLLFELILELRELEMNFKTKIHFIHVSGTRMIAQGSDGLSRGNLSEGVMSGTAMASFIPLNETALERSPALKTWIESWASGNLEFLEPKDWFVRGHDIVEGEFETNVDGFKWPTYRKGTFVWTPPPAAAETMLEEVRKARHRRTQSTHLILIPRLMTPMWQKHLRKVSDIVLSVPAGHPAWPVSMHEPLTIGIVFPFIRYRPWRLCRAPILLDLERKLREVWKTNASSEGPLLFELWSLPRQLGGLSQKLVWKLLRGLSRIEVSDCSSRKRRRVKMEEKEG